MSRLVEKSLGDRIASVLRKSSSLYIFKPRDSVLTYFFMAKNYLRYSMDFYLVTVGVVEPPRGEKYCVPATKLYVRRGLLKKKVLVNGAIDVPRDTLSLIAGSLYEYIEVAGTTPSIEIIGGVPGSIVIRGRTTVFVTPRPVHAVRRLYMVNERLAEIAVQAAEKEYGADT